jgi:transposase
VERKCPAHAAAIDVMTGELRREKFGPGIDAPLAWLGALPGPVRACYEAGPTGFGLYRAAVAAAIGMQVIAPGKTPRRPSDRVKTDREDAELLARLLLAGSLTRVSRQGIRTVWRVEGVAGGSVGGGVVLGGLINEYHRAA